MSAGFFSARQVGLAGAFATAVQGSFFLLLVTAGTATSLKAKDDPANQVIPIEVKPVLDDLPLLKKGGKRLKAKLPDMWVKRPPIRQYEAKSAPSPTAPDDVTKIPDSPLATRDAEAPPPDAEIVKKLDEDLPRTDAAPAAPLNVDQAGSQAGVDEGTETDPLKARAVSLYRMKIIGWFKARFRVPESIPCAEREGLRSSVAAQIGPDRTVTGFSVASASGNAVFDAQVRDTMQGIVSGHQELPPPPPNYPDILDTTVHPTFLGKGTPCQ